MAKFIFRIRQYNENFRQIDEFKDWISSDCRLNAWTDIDKAYPSSKGYDVELLDIE